MSVQEKKKKEKNVRCDLFRYMGRKSDKGRHVFLPVWTGSRCQMTLYIESIGVTSNLVCFQAIRVFRYFFFNVRACPLVRQ